MVQSEETLLSSAAVRSMIGDISDMTLWRWTKSLDFPKPDIVIQRRKFWRRGTVESWIAAHVRPQVA